MNEITSGFASSFSVLKHVTGNYTMSASQTGMSDSFYVGSAGWVVLGIVGYRCTAWEVAISKANLFQDSVYWAVTNALNRDISFYMEFWVLYILNK